MSTGERICRMDISITRGAKSSGISFTRDDSGGLFADFTHPDTFMAGGKLVSTVDFNVTRQAKVSGIGTAINKGRRRLANITRAGHGDVYGYGYGAPKNLQKSCAERELRWSSSLSSMAPSTEMQKVCYTLFPCASMRSTSEALQQHPLDSALTQVHVQALDEVVSANSHFTVAVFIGLSFTNPNSQDSLLGSCPAGHDFAKLLVVFEVISFSCFLLSSLVAHGLKLLVVLLNSKDHSQAISAKLNPKLLRLGMLVSAIGTVLGTVFLTLSMIYLIQVRLGVLSCDSSSWSKWAALPTVVMVSTGLLTFNSAALYAFIT